MRSTEESGTVTEVCTATCPAGGNTLTASMYTVLIMIVFVLLLLTY